MSTQQFAGANDRFLRRYEYDDSWVVAADLGVADDAVDVDVVGTTAIVVVATGDVVACGGRARGPLGGREDNVA